MPMQETQEMRALSLGWEDPLEQGMAIHSSNSCLGNPIARVWWAIVIRSGAKSWIQLKRLSTPAPRSFKEKERHTHRDQSGNDGDTQVLPVMLALSYSVGIFHRSLSRNKNQFKLFTGCSRSQEDWGANGAWFTNLHSPG